MFYKVKYVKPLSDMILLVQFENGITKTYDVSQMLSMHKDFEALKDDILFKLVQVDASGYGIYWNDYLDLSCNELWYNGIETDIFLCNK